VPIPVHCIALPFKRSGPDSGLAEPRVEFKAHAVYFALGRAGSPRQVGVYGEGMSKVAYGVEDTEVNHNRRILVVRVGLSAVEAALTLCSKWKVGQSDSVTLVHRDKKFT
jgi:thioredoxin reductase